MVSDSGLDILKCLATVYYGVHVVDLRTDEVWQFNADERLKKYVPEGPSASVKMDRSMNELVIESQRDAARKFGDLRTVAQRMKGKHTLSGEFIGVHIGWFKQQFICLEADEDGTPVKVIHTVEKIDEQKKREEDLLRISRLDELTGLLNRKAYEEELLAVSENPQKASAVYVAVDINELKNTNDSLGHNAGDELISGAADCLKKTLGGYGRLFRIGGDEFAAIIYAKPEELVKIQKDIEEVVSGWKGSFVPSLSLSCGIAAQSEYPGYDFSELAKIADQRMYQKKALYYQLKGMDRRVQHIAQTVIFDSYLKVLKVNLTDNTFEILKAEDGSTSVEKGFSDNFGEWTAHFAQSGQIHSNDKDKYLYYIQPDYLREYFAAGNDYFSFYYKRKVGDVFKDSVLEVFKKDFPNTQDLIVFVFVKDLHKENAIL
ncbi:MAG: GGDEF domain-containing protein [Treponema sp.]|nr:GGDEF domain-containing protein [Treponema sp.]